MVVFWETLLEGAIAFFKVSLKGTLWIFLGNPVTVEQISRGLKDFLCLFYDRRLKQNFT